MTFKGPIHTLVINQNYGFINIVSQTSLGVEVPTDVNVFDNHERAQIYI